MLPLLRQAVRSLAKSPGYTAIALLTLALGIGVNSAMFTLVDALLFRPAPFPESDRLVQVVARPASGGTRPYSYVELGEIRDRRPSFAALTALCHTVSGHSKPASKGRIKTSHFER